MSWYNESRRHALSAKGVNNAMPRERIWLSSRKSVVLSPGETAYRKKYELYSKDEWTEKELHLILRRINSGKITPQQVFKQNKLLDSGEGVALTKEQQQKGLDFLKKNQNRQDSIQEREKGIINDPNATIRLKDFHSERGDYYYPLYTVSGDGTSMEYYYDGRKINVLG